MRGAAILLVALLATGCATPGGGAPRDIVLGTTTTTQDTGLLDVLVAAFERDTGLRLKPVVGGTGEMHEKAKRGDIDVLLTHSPLRERLLLEEGWTTQRYPVMYNSFVIAGPDGDPAGVAAASDAADALARIRDQEDLFASRGDRSGTHEKELSLWDAAGSDASNFSSSWYKQTGAGQGQTLLYANERRAYTLVDDATLLQFHSLGRAMGTVDLFHEDPVLRNQYAVSLIDPVRVNGLDQQGAAAFAHWLTGPHGQATIAGYAIHGAQAFTPNAEDMNA